MKTFLFLLIFGINTAIAQWQPFQFAFISDTHIGSPNGAAEEDLRRTVADINNLPTIEFVVITGDITELGTDEELKLAKQILDSLHVPWYVIPGNHDTGWSESGGLSVVSVFGYDKFIFNHKGIVFIGTPSGPYLRMGDGHIPRDATIWMNNQLSKIGPNQPIVFLNHYPLDPGLDNWYAAIDALKKQNTIAVLCGHGHANKAYNFEGIPGVMGRSNLRAKAAIGGYNIVEVTSDSMLFSVREPATITHPSWTAIKLEKHNYGTAKSFVRPDFKVNDSFPQVKLKWQYASEGNVISTPLVINDLVIAGNSIGAVDALSILNGKRKWSYRGSGPVYSSPASEGNKIVFGSADGFVYCLNAENGYVLWKLKTGKAVLGNPLILNGKVYIGASDGKFRKISLKTGKEIWHFDNLGGAVTSTPVLYKNKIIFGAWDTFLYALDTANGNLQWKWSNGSAIRNYSPAACIPVVKDDVVYVVAPDRFITAIDGENGKTIWRNNDATVRESIGLSEDGNYVYGKTMNDNIVGYKTSKEKQSVSIKLNAGFGYEHVPSMLVAKSGTVFFGTKNGVVYAVDDELQHLNWKYKIDNSMVNTVNVITDKKLIVSTMDGKIVLLEVQ